jgi:hypothetical protein
MVIFLFIYLIHNKKSEKFDKYFSPNRVLHTVAEPAGGTGMVRHTLGRRKQEAMESAAALCNLFPLAGPLPLIPSSGSGSEPRAAAWSHAGRRRRLKIGMRLGGSGDGALGFCYGPGPSSH